MIINNLCIEVTRACNFACSHCLRGEQQDKNIEFNTIKNIFDAIRRNKIGVCNLTITGGEPFLNPEGIRWIANEIIKTGSYDVYVEGFYIATNGSVFSTEAMESLVKLNATCFKNSGEWLSKVCLSKDIYHDEFSYNDEWFNDKLNLFRGYRFFDEEQKNKGNFPHGLTLEGNAEKNRLPRARPNARSNDFRYDRDNDEIDMIYVNVNGDVLFNCDLSYEHQSYEADLNVNEPMYDLGGNKVDFIQYLKKTKIDDEWTDEENEDIFEQYKEE